MRNMTHVYTKNDILEEMGCDIDDCRKASMHCTNRTKATPVRERHNNRWGSDDWISFVNYKYVYQRIVTDHRPLTIIRAPRVCIAPLAAMVEGQSTT